MGFFKNVGKNVRRMVRKVVPKRPSSPQPLVMPHTGPGGGLIDPKSLAQAAFREVGETVVKTTKGVADGAGKAIETAGDFIGDTEHFLKTGDWARGVEKLQAEEADAEAKMWMARAAYDDARSVYVRSALKRRSLSLIHEQQTLDQPQRLSVPKTPDAAPDFYGSTTSRMLDKIGLGGIADTQRAIQTFIPVRLPHGYVAQQQELARARKVLTENIRKFRAATAKLSRMTADLIEQTDEITQEIETLEQDFLTRGVDLDTGATRDLADRVEAETKLRLAGDLLRAGMSAEDVAATVGLRVGEVEGLGHDA